MGDFSKLHKTLMGKMLKLSLEMYWLRVCESSDVYLLFSNSMAIKNLKSVLRTQDVDIWYSKFAIRERR